MNLDRIRSSGACTILITNTNVEGNLVSQRSVSGTFDGLTIHGEFVLDTMTPVFCALTSSTPQLLRPPSPSAQHRVQLEQTFVQGTQALVAGIGSQTSSAESQLEASSSVLAGPVSRSAGSVLSCTDTYGADYELLSASCQPQVP